MADAPDRIALAPGLDISRIVTGLWQVADMERDGAPLDREAASTAMLEYARAGFDAFDMADHYGSAELIAGRFLARVAGGEASGAHRPVALTKWCPGARPDDGGSRARRRRAQLAAPWRGDDRSPPVPLVELRASRLSRRDEGARQAQARRADPPSWSHEFRHGAFARHRETRRRDRLEPGLAFRFSTAARQAR